MWWRRQSWVAGKSRDSSWPHRCCPNSTYSWWREVIKYFAELLGPFQSSTCSQKSTLLCWPKMGFVPRLLWCCKLPSRFAGEVGEGEKTALRAPLLGSHLASPGLLVYLLGVRTSILSKSFVSISAASSYFLQEGHLCCWASTVRWFLE